MKSFEGGVHPFEKKQTSSQKIEKFPLPKNIVVHLAQQPGSASKPLVKAGDYVKTGQKIAEAAGFLATDSHSPVSGKILSIEKMPHPCGLNLEAVSIESDGKDEPADFKPSDPGELSSSEIIKIVKDAGIAGLGGAAFPTHIKLSPPAGKNIDTLIINGCECEPYLTCDHRLMLEEPAKIISGMNLILKALGVKNGIIALEDNKKDAAEKFEKLLKSDGRNISVAVLKTKYPQGAEKQLIKAVLNREVPSGKLPMDAGCVVQNVQTAKAVHDAVIEGRPLYERVITVCGHFKKTGNFSVRIGTLISDIVDFCGGFDGDVKKVLMGGPMMGIPLYTLDVSILKGNNGVLALTENETVYAEPSNCIRCGKCVDVCPVGLVPTMISRLTERERYEDLDNYSPLDCMECGACAYECPAKIHLVQNIKVAKIIVKRDNK